MTTIIVNGKKIKILIFVEVDGFHWNQITDKADYLDARGKGYPSRAAAIRAARENLAMMES